MELDEVIAALAQMPQALEKKLSGLPESQLRFQPQGGYFSLLENVCHLRDIEVEGYARRLNLLLEQERPALPDLDGAALARERRYQEQGFKPALAAFVAARRANLERLATVHEADLDRRGHMEKVGDITLAGLLALWVGHDAEHLQEIDGLLAMQRDPSHKPKRSLSLAQP